MSCNNSLSWVMLFSRFLVFIFVCRFRLVIYFFQFPFPFSSLDVPSVFSCLYPSQIIFVSDYLYVRDISRGIDFLKKSYAFTMHHGMQYL